MFETAQFMKHLSKLYRDTYITPLPSSVAGIVGAILGIERCKLRDFACEKGLLAGSAILGYEGTVDETMTVVKLKGWKEFIRAPKRNILLYKPRYKMAIASPDAEVVGELEDRLRRLSFEYEVFGGSDYNFVAEVGEPQRARLTLARAGHGYCRVESLEGIEGSGTVHLDQVNEAGLSRYAFGYRVTLKLKREALAVDDGEHVIFVHRSWIFLT